MRLLANENFPYSSIKILKESGFDVIWIGADHSGIHDTDVLELADAENRTILTFDKD
jgi:predicted nuclease of predicted toxin-antitoxin system